MREYELAMQEQTNSKVKSSKNNTGEIAAPLLHCTEIPQRIQGRQRGDRGGRGEMLQLEASGTGRDGEGAGKEMKRAVSLKCIFVHCENDHF